jgi:hypothetical protein
MQRSFASLGSAQGKSTPLTGMTTRTELEPAVNTSGPVLNPRRQQWSIETFNRRLKHP